MTEWIIFLVLALVCWMALATMFAFRCVRLRKRIADLQDHRPYQCYWSKRALEAEAEVKKLQSLHAMIK